MTPTNDVFALQKRFDTASVTFESNRLTVATGIVARSWEWSSKGFVTISLKDLRCGRDWVDAEPSYACDWAHPDLLADSEARLVSLKAHESTDEGFTMPHLEVVAEIAYPSVDLSARWVIWAYPNAEGLRTQLWWKRLGTYGPNESVERLPEILPVWAKPGTGVSSAEIHAHYELRFKLEGLSPNKSYGITLIWLDTDQKGHRQVVELSNTDGETVCQAVAETALPSTEADCLATPVSFVISADLHPDGSCLLVIKPAPGMSGATVRQLALYEAGESDFGTLFQADSNPIAQLDAPRLREHLATVSAECLDNRVDSLPISMAGKSRYAVGYYNDTQNRNKPETPILRAGAVGEAIVDWANAYFLEAGGGGLAMVKESHKCVNQSGVDTGIFDGREGRLANTGWGLSKGEIRSDRYRWCWASWTILYEGSGEDGRQRALKRFDALRYPVREARDLWTVVCTWGHGRNGREGRDAACEKEVLTEMEVLADLGIDMLLIDDGWQVSPQASSWQPDGGRGWKPHPVTYSDGWKKVIARKEALGLRLGLWGVAQCTGVSDLLWNWRALGFEQVKLDFAELKNHDELDALMRKVRDFMLRSEQRCIISWDTTENAARYGYFWAREYGNVHFMNRKPEKPERVIYVPWLALRDFWQLSHFQNLNKWQLTIQNPEVVNRELSDAWQHSAAYCVATALMGIPEFMAIPRHYSDQAKAEVRQLLAIYKRHRSAIFNSTVYPIGDEPTNGSWSGFQSCHAGSASGYLLLFRERLNQDPTKGIALRFLPEGRSVELTDLRSDEHCDVTVGEGGKVNFSIAGPGDFAFLKYTVRER